MSLSRTSIPERGFRYDPGDAPTSSRTTRERAAEIAGLDVAAPVGGDLRVMAAATAIGPYSKQFAEPHFAGRGIEPLMLYAV
jgi:hypothetical protein